MQNTIQKELAQAKRKMVDEVDSNGKKLAKLTRENVAIIEAMIQNDSAYLRSSDVEAEPKENKKGDKTYGGSSAYWMTQLKSILIDSGSNGECKYEYEEIIKGAVESVDRENSTHLNADKCGRQEITKRICDFDRKELIKCLKNPDYGNMKLFNEISKETSAGRRNSSFASKFCHYACFYVFEGTEYQDNYSIYDGILKKVLPWYCDYFHINKTQYDFDKYEDFRKAVDAVRNASEEKTRVEISRNGFDHLLWYYHKGRLKKDAIIKEA